ncbi:CoA ester lyase [Shouchella sp. JSM 1781072]|uniref:HpcH/HpaI aldolase/citrate lyase family protein n=1 Tax=Shouchella sp. JSM 1781072 TaxID=3344581 RepID=UPI0035C19133
MKSRSMLFVPASSTKMLQKGLQSNADQVIYDLEDSIAFTHKEEARERLAVFLNENQHDEKKIYIRINERGSGAFEEDLKTISSLSGIHVLLPKANHSDDIEYVNETLGKDHNRSIVPIIETAKGMWHVEQISTTRNVEKLAFGSLDYCLDLNIDPSPSGTELLYARSRIVLASKMASLAPPIDGVYQDIQNQVGFAHEAEAGKRLGFQGKLLIHPNQVEQANQCFAPSLSEIDEAKTIVEAFKESETQGKAAVQVNGKMVDYPVVKRAERLLQLFG